MSTIRRQSLLSTLFIYLGFAIGAVNILKLFPDTTYFDTAEFGLTRLLLDMALVFSTACTLGSVNIALKFFPFYESYLPKSKNDLPFLTLGLTIVGCSLFVIILPFFESTVLRKFGYRSPLFIDYFYLIYPFTISLALFGILEAFAWGMKKTVLSNFLKEFLFRLLTTVLIFLFISGIIKSFTGFITLYSYLFFVLVLVLLYVFIKSKKFPINFTISKVTRRLAPKIFVFGFSFFLSSLLNIIAKTNDTIIIASQSSGGLIDTAIFVIATYLVTIMDVPQRSVISATAPQIAVAWKERDTRRIDRLYKKSALNLLIAAIGILALLLLNVGDLVKYLGDTYAPIPFLVLILGLARLIDLGTGLNSQILLLSKYWRIDLFTNMFFVFLSILLNYFLTKKLGVIGPAWGNLIAIATFNFIRLLYIWKLFHLQPFSHNNVKALLIGAVAMVLVYFIPDTRNIYLNVFIRSILFIGLYAFAIIYFRISEDIIALVKIVRGKIKY